MLHMIQGRIKAIQEPLKEVPGLDPAVFRRLGLLQADLYLSHLFDLPFNIARYFKKFCILLRETTALVQACVVLDHQPGEPRQMAYFMPHGSKPESPLERILEHHAAEGDRCVIRRVERSEGLTCGREEERQLLLVQPVIAREHDQARLGYLFFWVEENVFTDDAVRIIQQFALLLADRIVTYKFERVQQQLDAANAHPSAEIKKVIRRCLTSMLSNLGCDYSVALVLKRSITDLNNAPARAGVQNYEVVTEQLKGSGKSSNNRSKATGFWIEEKEGLLALALTHWRSARANLRQGLTFHQTQRFGKQYICLETGQVGISLHACEDEMQEQSIHYIPLVHDGAKIGCLKLSYRRKAYFNKLDRALIAHYADFLARRVYNSFIYSMTMEQTRFFQQIKNMFERADQMHIDNRSYMADILSELSDMVIKTTGIDTVAIGILSKNREGEKIVSFPHPRGWEEAALVRYRELPVTDGLTGLAIRMRRNVFLAPVEEPQSEEEPESTIYVDESKPRFVDVRKHPDSRDHPGYKKLSSYYLRTCAERVYADYVFIIEYKNVVLGVIDVEVKQNNWDRFIGIGYLHFFRTLASMLALLFYRVRMAEEHARVVQAMKFLSDAVCVSPAAVVKAVLTMLRSTYRVEKAKIIRGDIFADPMELHLLDGRSEKYAHLFLGYDPEDIERFGVPGDRIDRDNLFLKEFKYHIHQSDQFYFYISNIRTYSPQFPDPEIREKFNRFRSQPRFFSYLAILLGDQNKSFGVLELVSGKINAFDDLLIDSSFIESWTAQISMALKYADTEGDHPGGELLPQSQREPGLLRRRGAVVPILQPDQIEKGFDLVGTGPSMMQLRDQIRRTSTVSKSPILIHGESGTGKELIAKAIHHHSGKPAEKIIAMDCGALPHDLVEDTLFGHVEGAYTTAANLRKGLFEAADGGTLFLDEIANLPLESQSKFLRVLEEYRIRPLGSSKTIPVNVQVITATNTDLQERMRAGHFRADLFYRLHVISIQTVPLRKLLSENPDNLLQLLSHLYWRYASAHTFEGFTKKSLEKLLAYSFPGNVRELYGFLQTALFNCADRPVLDIRQESMAFPHQATGHAHDDLLRAAVLFLRKYRCMDAKAVCSEEVVQSVLNIMSTTADGSERINAFLGLYRAIDVQMAALLMGSGATWARRRIRVLALQSHPLTALYLPE